MTFKWMKENQYTDYGLIRTGDIVRTSERGIPEEVARSWINDGWAEEINPSRKSRKKEEVNNG
jgi:hypothetical protein